MKTAIISKIICLLFGHKEKEIRHTNFYGDMQKAYRKDPIKSVSTFKCERCSNIRTHEITY